MAGADEREIKKLEIEKKRSAVRRWVTCGVIGVLGGLAGSISGFWFGSRRPNSWKSVNVTSTQ